MVPLEVPLGLARAAPRAARPAGRGPPGAARAYFTVPEAGDVAGGRRGGVGAWAGPLRVLA